MLLKLKKPFRYIACFWNRCRYKNLTINSMYITRDGMVYGRSYYCSSHQTIYRSLWDKPIRRDSLAT